MQFSLKDLLVIVAFVAVISWCAGQIGPDIASLWIVVIAMAFSATAFVAAARHKSGRWLVPFTPAIGLIPFCLTIFSPGVFLYAVLLFAGGVVILLFRPLSTKVLCAFVMVCMSAALIVDAREVQGRVQRLEALRREFPIVSLVSRLDYEQHEEQGADATAKPASTANDPLGGKVAVRLKKFEQDLAENQVRDWELKTLHDREYEGFVRSMGFGVMRMARPSAESMRRPPLRDLAFNEPSASRLEGRRDWNSAGWAGDSNTARRLYEVSRNDFLDPNGFGAIIKPKQAAGFIEHGMHFSPVDGLKDHRAWTIERLELLSLLKFDEPRVYVLDHLPRMDQLSGEDVPTRALDAFEKASLEKLRSDEDLVVREEKDVHRMLGALRAAKQCLECHSVERGELLGAFSYVLRRREKGEVGAAAGR